MSFTILQNIKTPLWAIKTRRSKSRKIDIFPKPLVLVQKWPFFQFFFLASIGQENVFYDILEQKNRFLAYKKKKFRKSKNLHFSEGVNPWFWSKNGHFSNFFFLGNKRKEHVFYDILEGENTFLGFKNKKFKKPKSDIFRKGLTHGFGLKMAIFPISPFL